MWALFSCLQSENGIIKVGARFSRFQFVTGNIRTGQNSIFRIFCALTQRAGGNFIAVP